MTAVPRSYDERIEYNVRRMVINTFVAEGLAKFTRPERVIDIFFGDASELTKRLREDCAIIFDTFKTPEQMRAWRGYLYEYENKNPLAMILMLNGGDQKWNEPFRLR